MKPSNIDKINHVTFNPTKTSIQLPLHSADSHPTTIGGVFRAGQRRLRTEITAVQQFQIAKNNVTVSEEHEIAEILIKYAPKAQGHQKTIHLAAEAGDERAVRLLIKHKGDFGADKSITLDLAIKSRSISLLKYLVEEEMYKSGNELYSAARYDFFDGFDYFLGKGYQVPKDVIVKSIYGHAKYILDMLGIGSDMRRVNFLVSRGADLSCIEESPSLLNAAIQADDMELMKFLLQHKAYVKTSECPWNSHPLNCAFSSNLGIDRKIEYAQALADSGMRIDPKISCTIWADFFKLTTKVNGGFNQQKTELIKSLIKSGLAFIDAPKDFPSSQRCALQCAMEDFKDYDLVELMLKMGADPNQKIYKETPLQTAIRIGNNRMITLLIKYGANLNDI